MRSEQFAVNEAIACLTKDGYGGQRGRGGAGRVYGTQVNGTQVNGTQVNGSQPGAARHQVFGVHAPEGTGIAEVFGDLVAAIVTERARHIADLPDPGAAFGETRIRDGYAVVEPVAELTGYEIVLTVPQPGTGQAPPGLGLPPIGAGWRDRATRADYFGSTARLADGVGAWAMLAARLGDLPANRAFAERWWRGAMRGTDVLFPAGDSMATALARLKGTAVYWPACVAWFRASLAKVQNLADERMEVATALSRLSQLEQAWEEASGSVELAEVRLAELTAREPKVREAVALADEDYRVRLASLGAHELGRPEFNTVTPQGIAALRSRGMIRVALAGGMRRGKNWRDWSLGRRELKAACASAERAWDAALRESESLRADVSTARAAVAEATAEVSRLAAEMEPLAATVAAARQRWGDHVPVGPSQAETEDPALIEWRETSAPWSDPEYANARTDAFIAALELHKALIAARADVFEANLEALMHLVSAEGAGAGSPAAAPGDAELAEFALAAWRSFFLAVPVVQLPFEMVGSMFADLAEAQLGWLLAGRADKLSADNVPAMLSRFDRAVFAGDVTAAQADVPAEGRVPAGREALAQAAGLPQGAELARSAGVSHGAGHAHGAGLTQSTGLASPPAPVQAAPVQAARLDGVPVPAQRSARTAQHVADEAVRHGTWLPSGAAEAEGPSNSAELRWVGTPLRVVRGQDRATVNDRNDRAYDGLLISDRD